MNKLYGCAVDPDSEITVTPGGTYAIYAALTTILRPGDEVILFEPAYDSYIPNIEINGGVPVRIPLRYPDYSIDWDEVRKRVNPRTRAIILNSPQPKRQRSGRTGYRRVAFHRAGFGYLYHF